MTVRVLLFGHYHDIASLLSGGDGDLTVHIDAGATVADLARALASMDQRLSDLTTRTRAAVRAEFASPDTVLCPDDEVAFLPPMSGG